MKNLKKFTLMLILLILPVALIFSGCSFNEVYVKDVYFYREIGNIDEYIIKYSDGTTSTFQVENGKNGENGKDGQDITLKSIFNELVELGKYEDTNEDFLKFIDDYLSLDTSVSIQGSVAKALQSAVSVYCEFPTTIIGNSGFLEKTTPIGCGAGVIFELNNDYAYILTNQHVVYDKDCDTINGIASKIKIFQYGTNEYVSRSELTDSKGYPIIEYGLSAIECEYVGGSVEYDVAVLKVNTSDLRAKNSTVGAIDVADNYSVAERVFAIGNPEGEGVSVTEGIVSKESEYIKMEKSDGVEGEYRVLRTDTAVNGGNSGGGLYNADGELIGLINAKIISSEIDNMAYALPIDNVKNVAKNIIYYYENQQATTKSSVKVNCIDLGLEIVQHPDESKCVYNPADGSIEIVESCIVKSVANRSLAQAMGISEKDKIATITINDITYDITRSFQFCDVILNIRAGDKLSIGVYKYDDDSSSYESEITYCFDEDNEGVVLTSDIVKVK